MGVSIFGAIRSCREYLRNRHLAPKRNTQLAAGKLAPKSLLRFCRLMPHDLSTLRKQRLEPELLTRLCAHNDLRRPAHQLGFATHGATIHDTREPAITGTGGAWRESCAAQRRPADVLGASIHADKSCERSNHGMQGNFTATLTSSKPVGKTRGDQSPKNLSQAARLERVPYRKVDLKFSRREPPHHISRMVLR